MRTTSINYGAEGSIIGHELTHEFDDQGRKFDLKGNLRDWWTPEDAKEYDERGACVAKEYTVAVPGIPGQSRTGDLRRARTRRTTAEFILPCPR